MKYTFYHRRPKPDNPCYVEGKYWYIGSTMEFDGRRKRHNNKWRRDQPFLKDFVEQNGGCDAWEFEVLEESDHETRSDSLMREQHFLDLHNPCLNLRRAYNSEEQEREFQKRRKKKYREGVNREIYLQKNRANRLRHYKANKAEVNRKQSELLDCSNCDKKYTRSNMARHKKTKYCMNFKK